MEIKISFSQFTCCECFKYIRTRRADITVFAPAAFKYSNHVKISQRFCMVLLDCVIQCVCETLKSFYELPVFKRIHDGIWEKVSKQKKLQKPGLIFDTVPWYQSAKDWGICWTLDLNGMPDGGMIWMAGQPQNSIILLRKLLHCVPCPCLPSPAAPQIPPRSMPPLKSDHYLLPTEIKDIR